MDNIVTMNLTAAGLRLYGKIQTGNATMSILRVDIGSGYLAENEKIEDLTTLKNTVDVNTQIYKNEIIGNGQTKLSVRITDGSEDFYLREIGVIAEDPDDGEILYCYCNYGDYADYIMSYGEELSVTQEAEIYFTIGTAETVNVNFAKDTAAVSHKEFEDHTKNEILNHPDGSVTIKKLEPKLRDTIISKLGKKIVSALPTEPVLYDFSDGKSVFAEKGTDRMTVEVADGMQKVTAKSGVAAAKPGIVYFDFSDITSGAKKVTIEYDSKISTGSRWGISLVDMELRPETTGSGINVTGSALWHGTKNGTAYYVNDSASSKWSDLFGQAVNVLIEADIEKRTLNYRFQTEDGIIVTEGYNTAFIGSANQITGIELYSWVANNPAYIDNISITAAFDDVENMLYMLKNDNGTYGAYVYIDGIPVKINDLRINPKGGLEDSTDGLTVRTHNEFGLAKDTEYKLVIAKAEARDIDARTNPYKPIVPLMLGYAVYSAYLPYAECTTAGSTAAKTAAVTDFVLKKGAHIHVKFANENSSTANATLNINNTGAKPIVVHCGTTNLYVNNYYSWLAGETVEFIYDGTNYVAVASDMRFITGAQSGTVVIGTMHTEGYCDFRCNGTNDSEIFNKAIARLNTLMSHNKPSADTIMWRQGGTILVKTGHYQLTTALNLRQTASDEHITFAGEGRWATWISSDGLSQLIKSHSSVIFKNLTLEAANAGDNEYITNGNHVTFENCDIYIDDNTTGDISGTFINSVNVTIASCDIEIKVTKGTPPCFSGICCNNLQVTGCTITLENNSTDANTEVNLVYDASDGGVITGCVIKCIGRSTITNADKINMSDNIITLSDSKGKISHYNASVTTLGGIFEGNTVHAASSVYMRFSAITGNIFRKTNNANTGTYTLYNTCSSAIVGNRFDGGTSGSTHGGWQINSSSKLLCKDNISIGTLSKSSNVPTASLFADNLNVE